MKTSLCINLFLYCTYCATQWKVASMYCTLSRSSP